MPAMDRLMTAFEPNHSLERGGSLIHLVYGDGKSALRATCYLTKSLLVSIAQRMTLGKRVRQPSKLLLKAGRLSVQPNLLSNRTTASNNFRCGLPLKVVGKAWKKHAIQTLPNPSINAAKP
jgi:IS4 transposase